MPSLGHLEDLLHLVVVEGCFGDAFQDVIHSPVRLLLRVDKGRIDVVEEAAHRCHVDLVVMQVFVQLRKVDIDEIPVQQDAVASQDARARLDPIAIAEVEYLLLCFRQGNRAFGCFLDQTIRLVHVEHDLIHKRNDVFWPMVDHDVERADDVVVLIGYASCHLQDLVAVNFVVSKRMEPCCF